MTNKQFKKIFSPYKKEAMACLVSGDYAWDDEKRTLRLMGDVLKHIPDSLYPKNIDDRKYLTAGNWKLRIELSKYGQKMADLSYAKDDHSAWVVYDMKKNKWIDYDIGGS